jgi:hypothetical protein
MENWRKFMEGSLREQASIPFPKRSLEEGMAEIAFALFLGRGGVAVDSQIETVYDAIQQSAQQRIDDDDRISAKNEIANMERITDVFRDTNAALKSANGNAEQAAETLKSQGYTVELMNIDNDPEVELVVDAELPRYGSSSVAIDSLNLPLLGDLEVQQDTGDTGDTRVPGTYSSTRTNVNAAVGQMDLAHANKNKQARNSWAQVIVDHHEEHGEGSVGANELMRAKQYLGLPIK